MHIEDDQAADALEAVVEVLIKNGTVLRNNFVGQRPLSLRFLRMRIVFFRQLLDELMEYEGIWANWRPSDYHSEFPDPYLSFEANDSTFMVGCRKKVFTVAVEFPHKMDVSMLAKLAEADSVTYESSPRGSDEAQKILIRVDFFIQ